MLRGVATLTAVGLLLLAASASATVLAPWSLDEVARRADSIVVGVVESQRPVRDALPMTESLVRVEQTLYGPDRDLLVLSQIGGRHGDQLIDVVGDAHLEVGDRVLLFTFLHRDGRRYLVGMALGAYHLDGEDRLTQRIDAAVLGSDGRALPAPGLRTESLQVVQRVIRRVKR